MSQPPSIFPSNQFSARAFSDFDRPVLPRTLIQAVRFITHPDCGIFHNDRHRGQSAWPREISLADPNFMLPFRP